MEGVHINCNFFKYFFPNISNLRDIEIIILNMCETNLEILYKIECFGLVFFIWNNNLNFDIISRMYSQEIIKYSCIIRYMEG